MLAVFFYDARIIYISITLDIFIIESSKFKHNGVFFTIYFVFRLKINNMTNVTFNFYEKLFQAYVVTEIIKKKQKPLIMRYVIHGA